MSKYTQREWDRVVGWGKVPPKYKLNDPIWDKRWISDNDENIQRAGVELPISRLVVNQPSSTSAGGSLTNGFAPTTTLGCGSWGGNSISENLDYKHLMNVSRIGKVIPDKKVPTDDEIWA